jgi:hypothetical protein
MKRTWSILFMFLFLVGLARAVPSITVLKPAAGDPWIKSQSFAITWIKSGTMPNSVKITLRNQNSTANVRDIADGVPNSGSYMWQIPADIPDGSYVVRVKAKGSDVFGDSGIFSIASSQEPPSQHPKFSKQMAKIGKFFKVVDPTENSAWRNGQDMYIRFDAHTRPNDGLDIEIYRVVGNQKIGSVYSGGFGEGSPVPPEGPAHPYRYYYKWSIPFGDMFGPGYYKLRFFDWGEQIEAWSPSFYLTWPMKMKEYLLDAAIVNTTCVSDAAGLAPYPVRPRCEELYFPNHAYVGYDVFDYPGSIHWEDGQVHPYWRKFISHSQLKFAFDQFKDKKVKLHEAKLLLKKECTVNVNSNLGSCAGRLYRLDGPYPTSSQWNQCISTQKTALEILLGDLTEKSIYVTQTVEYWINGTIPNHGFLLTVANEDPPISATTCKSAYSMKLYLKIEVEYKGYE